VRAAAWPSRVRDRGRRRRSLPRVSTISRFGGAPSRWTNAISRRTTAVPDRGCWSREVTDAPAI